MIINIFIYLKRFVLDKFYIDDDVVILIFMLKVIFMLRMNF